MRYCLLIFKNLVFLSVYIVLSSVKLNLSQLLKESKNDYSVILETKLNFK